MRFHFSSDHSENTKMADNAIHEYVAQKFRMNVAIASHPYTKCITSYSCYDCV